MSSAVHACGKLAAVTKSEHRALDQSTMCACQLINEQDRRLLGATEPMAFGQKRSSRAIRTGQHRIHLLGFLLQSSVGFFLRSSATISSFIGLLRA